MPNIVEEVEETNVDDPKCEDSRPLKILGDTGYSMKASKLLRDYYRLIDFSLTPTAACLGALDSDTTKPTYYSARV